MPSAHRPKNFPLRGSVLAVSNSCKVMLLLPAVLSQGWLLVLGRSGSGAAWPAPKRWQRIHRCESSHTVPGIDVSQTVIRAGHRGANGQPLLAENGLTMSR
jgi:hypothetical protein